MKPNQALLFNRRSTNANANANANADANANGAAGAADDWVEAAVREVNEMGVVTLHILHRGGQAVSRVCMCVVYVCMNVCVDVPFLSVSRRCTC